MSDRTMEMAAVNHSPEVLELALGIGEAQLAAGAPAATVRATIESVMAAYGLIGAVADVTYTAITVSVPSRSRTRSRGAAAMGETAVRVVRLRSQDYTRLVEVTRLVEDIVVGRAALGEAVDRLAEIVTAVHPYRRYLCVTAWGTMSASVAVLLGAGLIVAASSFLLACLIYAVTRLVYKHNLPAFVAQMAGAFCAVGAGAGVAALDLPVRTSLVVVSGIVVLLAGVTFVAAVSDALDGYLVTATARLLEVGLLTGGVIAGAAFGLEVVDNLGVDFPIVAQAGAPPALPIALGAAGLVSAAFAYASYAPKRTLAACLAAGVLAQGVFMAMSTTGFATPWAAGVAALVVAAVAHTGAGPLHSPGLLTTTAGLIPLLPGMAIYQGLFDLAGASNLQGLITLCSAMTLGAALACGALLGERISHPVLRRLHWKRPRPFPRPRSFRPRPRVS